LAYLWKHEHFEAVGLVAGAELLEGQQWVGAVGADEIPGGFEVTEENIRL
jgi:hypothetical protein